jgi:hypothetical protein
VAGVIDEEVVSEKRLYEKTALTETRVMMFREKMVHASRLLQQPHRPMI